MSNSSTPTNTNNLLNSIQTVGGTVVSGNIDINDGDFIGRDKIINYIIQGFDGSLTRYDGLVRNFLDYYLGSTEHPAPFGGRATDLTTLDSWLNDTQAPHYTLLTAPAGRGKSALLSQWVLQLQLSTSIHIVYFPISTRFNTNTPNVVFAALAARLAYLHGKSLPYLPNADAREYRNYFTDLVSQKLPEDKRLLVVIDGLDEITDLGHFRNIFPSYPLDHLRVLVAVRPLANDQIRQGWLVRLGWQPRLVHTITLEKLSQSGVVDILNVMQGSLNLANFSFDLVRRLYELSEGEPLLIRWYIEALQERSHNAMPLRPEELLNLKPGLEPLINLWLDQLEALDTGSEPLRNSLLNALTIAFGPLTIDDFMSIAPDRFGDDHHALRRAIGLFRRFVIGDGIKSGYVFSHPLLRDYFTDIMPSKVHKQWLSYFLNFGKETLVALQSGSLEPRAASSYAVRYYGAHLTESHASPSEFYALLCEVWLRAWTYIEGTPSGFLNDVRRTWNVAASEGGAALGQVVRGSLCFSSISSLNANISTDLLALYVKTGVIDPKLALVIARTKTEPDDRARALAAVSEYLSNDTRPAIFSEIISAIKAIEGEWKRGKTIGIVFEFLKSDISNILAEILLICNEFEDPVLRATTLAPIVYRLPIEQQLSIRDEVLVEASSPLNEFHHAKSLVIAARFSPIDQQVKLLSEALEVAQSIRNDYIRSQVLILIANHAPKEATTLLEEIIKVAFSCGYEKYIADVLNAVAQHLPVNRREQVLKGVLQLAKTISDKTKSAYMLASAAEQLTEENVELLEQILTAARQIQSDDLALIHVLSTVSQHLPEERQTSVLIETTSTVLRTKANKKFTSDSVAVIQNLPLEQLSHILEEILATEHNIKDEVSRVSALSRLMPFLITEQRADLIDWILNVINNFQKESRQGILLTIVQWLPAEKQTEVLTEALRSARSCKEAEKRASLLSRVAALLPSQQRETVLSEAIRCIYDAGPSFYGASNRWSVLNTVLEKLPEVAIDLLDVALTVARDIGDEGWRVRAILDISDRLPITRQEGILDEALSVARKIANHHDKANRLLEVAVRLQTEQQVSVFKEAMIAAQQVSDRIDYADIWVWISDALTSTTRNLSDEVLVAVRGIKVKEQQAIALSVVAQWFPLEQQVNILNEALEAVRNADNIEAYVRSLCIVSRRLPPNQQKEVLNEALNSALKISDKKVRAILLLRITQNLPTNMKDWQQRYFHSELLSGLYELRHTFYGIDVLTLLVSNWKLFQQVEAYPIVFEITRILQIFADTKREHLLKVITILIPTIAQLGGERALFEAAQAVIDVGRWWP